MPMDLMPDSDVVDASALSGWVDRLADLDTAVLDEAACIDLIGQAERVKAALAAAQARLTVRVDRSVRERHAAAGLPPQRRGRGVAHQVALARRESPHQGGRHLGLAKALVTEMPETLAALARGEVSEWRATIVARETAQLSVEHRAEVDRRIGGRIAQWGDAQTAGEARRLAQALDPAAAVKRARKAAEDRHVSIRPAPDCMTYVTGLLPVAQGVSVYAALVKEADSARAAGDERSKGQVMADTLVERVTGRATAGDVAVEVDLVMTDAALFADDPTPAQVAGCGPVPAGIARDLVRDTLADVFVRRLYTDPVDGSLVAMDSHRRRFDGQLRRWIVIRDQFCRQPWCDAPIRHGDHPVPVVDGGETSAANAAGLCEACNYAKQAPGWRVVPDQGAGPHTLTSTSPTGHTYRSRAPDPPGARDPRDAWVQIEPGRWVLAA
jgi:Domain of unknown function (DUF222)